jgi:phosphoglycolate phosphatase-like HAD superfamily hydrolase
VTAAREGALGPLAPAVGGGGRRASLRGTPRHGYPRGVASLPSFRVGALEVAPALVLAPMSGVTDMAFRRLVRECSPGAVGLVVSEFISIEGLTRRDLKSHKMLRYHRDERPIGIQIFGADIDRMTEAAAIVQETGADLVDINCGCPVPKVVKRGGGAELLRRIGHLERMLRVVRREMSVPLTLKIRTGWDADSINAVEVAQMAEAAGVALLTVHGRTRVQLYTGAADWERIAAVKASVGIPVVGSGDVVSVATARHRPRRDGKPVALLADRRRLAGRDGSGPGPGRSPAGAAALPRAARRGLSREGHRGAAARHGLPHGQGLSRQRRAARGRDAHAHHAGAARRARPLRDAAGGARRRAPREDGGVSARGGARAVLFDLDGTLISSRGTPEIFAEIAARVFETPVAPLDVRPDGLTDPEILSWILAQPASGAPAPTPRLLARFEAEWARALRAAIGDGRVRIEPLPGARELLAALGARRDRHLAVVTGNLRSSARVKLAAAGLDGALSEGAYGSDAPSRAALPPRALERLARATGFGLAPGDAVVVGDTPHDLAAARACGMGCVLVATGGYARHELAALGPDALLDGLDDCERAVEHVLGARGASAGAATGADARPGA